MPEAAEFSIAAEDGAEGKAGAVAAFSYDRMTVERFRAAFPGARWRDDLRAWFVPGVTAERRLGKWLGREMAGVLAHADERGRDAYVFEPIESPYLEVGDDLVVRTPFSRAVVEELRAVPWAWWDGAAKAWRVPFRSFEALRARWPAIEAAAARNTPEARRTRREAARGSADQLEAAARAAERRRRRYPVAEDRVPPLDRVVMTWVGLVVFTGMTGELVDAEVARRFYPGVAADGAALIWASWRKPAHGELVQAWPARVAASDAERARGWWQPVLAELRVERRRAARRG